MDSIISDFTPKHNPYKKQCRKCQEWKIFHDFGPEKRASDGLKSRCKKCLYQENCDTNTPESHRKHNLKSFYGITPKQYDQMLEAQGGVCAACGQPETIRKNRGSGIRMLAIDHDHKTGDVRALLCSTCNTAYGMLQESSDRVRKLLAYAERMESREPSDRIVQMKLLTE